MRILLSLLVLMEIIVLSSGLQAQDLKHYAVKRTPEPLVIDGKLNESAWGNADVTDNFVIYTDGSAPVFPTRAEMLWDDEYLYVAFIMTDRDVWGKMKTWKPGDFELVK